MEPTQILLAVVVTILTGLLVFVGVQVFFILREMQKSLQKLNKILDNAGIVTDTVVKPIVGIASFVEGISSMSKFVPDGIKGIKGIVDLFHDKATPSHTVHEKVKASPVDESVDGIDSPNIHTHILDLQERGRRFFHRGGKPLTS